jgi:hypothetical protein
MVQPLCSRGNDSGTSWTKEIDIVPMEEVEEHVDTCVCSYSVDVYAGNFGDRHYECLVGEVMGHLSPKFSCCEGEACLSMF